MDQQTKIAILAACSALAGVVISQSMSLLISFLDKRHKKQILLRQKYEEMMFNFQDSLTYYSDVGNCRSLEQLIALNSSISAQRAIGLAMLYFPKFVDPLEKYINNQVAYYQLAISSFNPNIPATAGAQVRVHNKEKTETIESMLFKSKNKILIDLKNHVKEYTKA